MLEQSLPDVWRHVHDAQREVAGTNRADLAQEEALTALVEDVAVGHSAPDPGSGHRRFQSLRRNRRHKHRHRRLLDVALVGGSAIVDSRPLMRIAARRALQLVGETVTPDEWDVLVRMAIGWSARDLGIECGLTASAMKARVHRVRRRVLRGATAPTISEVIA